MNVLRLLGKELNLLNLRLRLNQKTEREQSKLSVNTLMNAISSSVSCTSNKNGQRRLILNQAIEKFDVLKNYSSDVARQPAFFELHTTVITCEHE